MPAGCVSFVSALLAPCGECGRPWAAEDLQSGQRRRDTHQPGEEGVFIGSLAPFPRV